MRTIHSEHISGSDQRRQWVQAAHDVAFAVGLFFGVVGLFIVAAVVCGLIWMAVTL